MSAEEPFNTNVPDKDERKNIRRQRIEARAAEGAPGSARKLTTVGAADDGKFRGQQQIATSLVHLDKKKSTGIDDTTMVRVTADLRENQRRVAEEAAREERMRMLDEEAGKSAEDNAAIEARWAELVSKDVPQDLHKAIEEQKARCAAVLASKDTLIAEFHLELKLKDEEYVRGLKQQAEDVDELLKRMRREFKELSDEYEVELESIEDAFLSERSEMLKKNKAEVDSLFERRRQAELDYTSAKKKREESHQAEIEDLIVHDHEEYSKLKIKLETDIQTLEQQLEEMQATYQLNTEKLEYNYRVLTERDAENSATLQQLKRKQTKLKETMSTLTTKYRDTEERDRKKNDELTEAYRAITKQYKDLQVKFRHFELADNKRFDELWAMHEEEVAGCVSKVLQADELITTQQLGWEWTTPDLSTLRYGGGGGGGGGGAGGGGAGAQSGRLSLAAAPAAAEAAAEAAAAAANGARMVSGEKMKAMMALLVDEGKFLVDSRVKEGLALLSEGESELAQAESMLKALGVESEAEVHSLLEFFFPVKEEEEDDAADDDTSLEEVPLVVRELQRLISPDAVVAAIGAFVDAKKAVRAAGATMGTAAPGAAAPAPGGGGGGNGGGGGAAGEGAASSPFGGAFGGGALDARREERAYWARAAGVLGEDKLTVWTQLESALVKYNKVLEERSDCISEVESLQRKNASLKELLHTYLGARVNEELIIPPNQTIRLGED